MIKPWRSKRYCKANRSSSPWKTSVEMIIQEAPTYFG